MHKKKVISLTVSVLVCCACLLKAQDVKTIAAKSSDVSSLSKVDTGKKKWDVSGLISLAFSQVSFTNWAAGGQDSLGRTSLASFHANYKDGNFQWLNDIGLAYGFQRLDNSKPQKTTDQIAAPSKAGYKI